MARRTEVTRGSQRCGLIPRGLVQMSVWTESGWAALERPRCGRRRIWRVVPWRLRFQWPSHVDRSCISKQSLLAEPTTGVGERRGREEWALKKPNVSKRHGNPEPMRAVTFLERNRIRCILIAADLAALRLRRERRLNDYQTVICAFWPSLRESPINLHYKAVKLPYFERNIEQR